VSVADTAALKARLYAALKHSKGCSCGECSGGLNAVDALCDRVASLDAENERLRGLVVEDVNRMNEWRKTCESLEHEIERLREALEPFAEIPVSVYGRIDPVVVCRIGRDTIVNARAALAAAQQPPGESVPDRTPQDDADVIRFEAIATSIEAREVSYLRHELERLTRAFEQACSNLAVLRGTREEGRSVGDDAELWKACLLAGWAGWQGYREEFGDVRLPPDPEDAGGVAAAQQPPARDVYCGDPEHEARANAAALSLLNELKPQETRPCRCTHMGDDPEAACCAHGMTLLCCCRAAQQPPGEEQT